MSRPVALAASPGWDASEVGLDELGRWSRSRRDLLVAAGGDGTLHLLVERVITAGIDAAIGLVPLGTGNDFARGLDLPLDPAAAVERLRSGTESRIDVLRSDDGGVVVNAAHAGLGAVAAARAEGLKASLGPLAYPVGALIAAVVADGRLDVVVAAATGRRERAAFGAALRDGSHLERHDVFHARAGQVRISGDAVAHDVDGEIGGEVTDRSYRVEPGAVRLLS